MFWTLGHECLRHKCFGSSTNVLDASALDSVIQMPLMECPGANVTDAMDQMQETLLAIEY